MPNIQCSLIFTWVAMVEAWYNLVLILASMRTSVGKVLERKSAADCAWSSAIALISLSLLAKANSRIN